MRLDCRGLSRGLDGWPPVTSRRDKYSDRKMIIYEKISSVAERFADMARSEILCHVCLGSGEYIHRNYLSKEVGRETRHHCKGTGKGLLHKVTGEFLANDKNPLSK